MSIAPVQDDRIHIEKINAPCLYTLKATGPEFGTAIRHRKGLARIARERNLCAAVREA
ncbi:hypothetical protein SAMN05192541_1713 [Bradyrhizobium arachidis]|nr:hypothetical protein SAMN05192541_1713 [Bradyrhizobium arachidis]